MQFASVLESIPHMERAGVLLGKALRRLDCPEAAFAWLKSTWPTIVGRTLAAHTRPVRCDHNCLELSVDGKAWQQQVENMRLALCARINQSWGANLVSTVKCVPAKHGPFGASGREGPGSVSRETDNEFTPFIRRRPV